MASSARNSSYKLQVHCDSLSVNQEVNFIAEIILDERSCTQQQPLEFDIEVFGQAASSLHVTVRPQCACGCSAGGQGGSGICTGGRGTLVCGACLCQKRYQVGWLQKIFTDFWFCYLSDSRKGKVTRDGYFFKGLNILISTFCVCADGFQGQKIFKLFICLFEFTK
jgi:hypothetical protein